MNYDFNNYLRAQAETKAARAERDAAGHKLNRCIQAERAAEIKSQHDPLAAIIRKRNIDPFSKTGKELRKMMIEAAHYIMTGRTEK